MSENIFQTANGSPWPVLLPIVNCLATIIIVLYRYRKQFRIGVLGPGGY